MIPLTRKAMRALCSRRMLFMFSSGAKYFFACLLLLTAGTCAATALPLQASQDSGSKPAPAPAAQQPQAGSSNAQSNPPDVPTPLKKAVHQKKVLTEDDLVKPPETVPMNNLDGEENNPACDHACEAALRAELGFGQERDAEFRNQLTLVRHDISYDQVWTSNLHDALEAANGYCDIQRQVDKIVSKGAVSTYTRNDVHSRFADREQKFVSQYRNAKGFLDQHIEAVQRFASFRATVMQYQLSGTLGRACPDYNLP